MLIFCTLVIHLEILAFELLFNPKPTNPLWRISVEHIQKEWVFGYFFIIPLFVCLFVCSFISLFFILLLLVFAFVCLIQNCQQPWLNGSTVIWYLNFNETLTHTQKLMMNNKNLATLAPHPATILTKFYLT